MSEWSPAEYAGRALPDADPETAPGKPPHAMLGREMECRPCAYGGYIWANRSHPAPSVAAHNATPGHARWWQQEREAWGEE